MTNLDSILKSRDITLPTKVHLVKAMVFPTVVYVCESWTIRKAEHWIMYAFQWYRLNQSILKKINPEYSLKGVMMKLKFQYSGHLMWRTNPLEKTLMLGKIEGDEGDDRGWNSWTASLTQWTWIWATSGDGEEQGNLACCKPYGQRKLYMTERLNNNLCLSLSLYIYIYISPYIIQITE